jgi:hypothetical protein
MSDVPDAGTLLWETLKEELHDNEHGFKERMVALDNVVKGFCPWTPNLLDVSKAEASCFIPPGEDVADSFPWHGCKFAACVVMYLVSSVDIPSKRNAVKRTSQSLGGLAIPSPLVLSIERCPYILSKTYANVKSAALTEGSCSAILISITDVEIMRNPSKRGTVFMTSRPGTFAHFCVMTVSPVGVYLYHGYGPRGYTLLQHMEKRDASYPISFDDTEHWLQRFGEFAADLGGVWTKTVNAAYAYCFDVDLVDLGAMRVGSQLDAYVTCQTIEFDAYLVRDNFSLLPFSRSQRVCLDGKHAKSKAKEKGHVPDGGIPHYYVPEVLRCGSCGAQASSNMKRCTACKKVSYCSRECQVKDWKLRHKGVCKSLSGKVSK